MNNDDLYNDPNVAKSEALLKELKELQDTVVAESEAEVVEIDRDIDALKRTLAAMEADMATAEQDAAWGLDDTTKQFLASL